MTKRFFTTSHTIDTSGMFRSPDGLPSPPAVPPPPPPPRPTVIAGFDLVPAALAVGAGVSLTALTLAGVAYLAIPSVQAAPSSWVIFPLGCSGGLLTAGVLIARWMYTAATRAWRIDDEERTARLAALAPPLDDLDLNIQPPVTPAELLKLAGYNLLVHHYVTGAACTREECEATLHMTQDEWNKCNTILKALGLKGPRGWAADLDLSEAVSLWRQISIAPDNSAQIPTGNHSYRRLEL